MALPTFITNIQPVEWKEVSLSNLNPSQREVKVDSVKNKTAKDVSDGTVPHAELKLPDMEDYSVSVKSNELLDYTISIDANNAAKVDNNTELTKIRSKSYVKENMLGALVIRQDKTSTLYLNPLQALVEFAPSDTVQLVSYDSYANKDWKSVSLSDIHRKVKSKLNEASFNGHELTNYLVVQYHSNSKVDPDQVLNILRQEFECPDIKLVFHNEKVAAGKMWFSCENPETPLPDKLPISVTNRIINSLRDHNVSDAFIVSRFPFEDSTNVEL